MARVLQGFAEVKVTGYTAHILRWAGPFAFKAGQFWTLGTVMIICIYIDFILEMHFFMTVPFFSPCVGFQMICNFLQRVLDHTCYDILDLPRLLIL